MSGFSFGLDVVGGSWNVSSGDCEATVWWCVFAWERSRCGLRARGCFVLAREESLNVDPVGIE